MEKKICQMSHTETLKLDWIRVCNDYLRAFCERHDIENIDYDLNRNNVWVGNKPGTTACIGDMFVSMDDIRYDVDHVIHPDAFSKWYWTSVDRAELGIKYMNYESFCRGCPDPISPEQLEKILESRERLIKARNEFYQAIDEYRDSNFQPLF